MIGKMIKIIYRFACLLLAMSLLVGTNLVVHASGTSAPFAAPLLTITPAADAFVLQSTPSSNYGSNTSLRVEASPRTRTYLRFVVNGLNGAAVQSAVLRIYAISANTTGLSVKALANNTWSENQITFANSPAPGSLINTSKPFGAGVWVTIDLSRYIKASGTYSLVLTSSSTTNTNLASRELAGKAPQLVLTVAGQATKTSAPTLTPAKTLVPTKTPTSPGGQPSFPIRAAFYYPWFPQAWTQQGIYPYTNYNPKLGFYSSTDQNILKQHIAMLQYGNIQAGIASWWGQGSQTDTKIAGLLTAAAGTSFRWALYYENESQADPTVAQIRSDLTYILNHYSQDPAYLRVNGKFVVFVYANTNDGCGMADRWEQANTVGAYVALKVFAGYANCASQPNAWHQYSPAVASDQQGSSSFSISPGFWLKGTPVRLPRDLTRWSQNVRDMVASGAKWQLVTTFNEWGEGTSVEPALEWASTSGFGQYLDILHSNGK